MKHLAGIFLLLFSVLVFFACESKKAVQEDLYPNFPLPAYTGAFDIIRNNDIESFGKSVVYNIDFPYPPKDLIDFYFDYFEKRNLKIIANDSLANQKWQIEDSVPRTYAARWADKNVTVLMTLTYKNKYKDNKSDGCLLQVTCFIHPFISSDQFEKFIAKTKTPEWSDEFQYVLENYVSKDQPINLEKALKDNPDSKLIKEFVSIEKEMRMESQEKYNAYIKSTH
jgi:hypothetical protein